MKLKKVIASILAIGCLSTGLVGMSASAANGTLTINTSSATLKNESGATRYGNVNFIVIDRATGSQVVSAGNSGNVANYASLTASKGNYSSVTYRFKANATLYIGTSQYSGALWSDVKEY